jgi:hypothetical protein
MNELTNLTPAEKLDFFRAEWRSHFAVYGEIDAVTGETFISPAYIFDLFLELNRIRFGSAQMHFAVNAARMEAGQ